ncbi:hypothetical protein EVJ58_g6464 [Rhodofomes roseus]|uniref:N-acetyltransferase domain-containing protein n=1 Tax=Rhodofomes roseus TaxID=34475 RepID=A0A4Y9Y8I5_9APHY|nr:hypothetical protein EVJ58_g6464 [Rhodofomes roseus]
MDAPQHDIVIVPRVGEPGRDELRQECYDVRIDVFHHEQQFPLDTEIDDLDSTATHILLRLLPSLKPVGTIRCTKHDNYYKLSRLAVLKDYRQYRFGRALVLALHDHVKRDAKQSGQHDSVTIKCHSQIPVKAFYAK